MRDGTERKSSSSSSPAPDCDVGLGLRLQPQPTDSYGGGGGGGGGGASFFSSASNQFAFMGEIYEAADRMFLPRGFHTTSLTPSGGMGVCGKALFTNTQWQELERQKMVHKYILASIPVPPQLLLPTSTAATSSTTPAATLTPGQDLVRYPGNGSDPEPWRCKRTDGKKWRCSRDVAPNQKYCERHAHKSRPRSRKHVETPSHNNQQIRSTPLFPTMASSTPSSSSFDQTRCIEWFMRGGTTTHQEKNVSVLYEHGKQQAAAATASFMSLNNNNNNINTNINKNNDNNNSNNNNPSYYSKLSSNKTRHFIDAWEKEGIFESPSSSSSSCKKFSPSSLSLSMSGDNNNINNSSSSNYNDNINDHEKPQWMMSSNNHVSWMMNDSCSSSPLPPGGPLGEALCLGGGNVNAHHQGYYGNKSNANSSSCSKSSCEDGDRALNFIG
ncbi:hypothetical protein ABFS83_05G063900 [Erythranthe nasuta]